MTSCKSKKPVAAIHPTPKKTETTEKPATKAIANQEKHETKPEEIELKKPVEEIKLETKSISDKTLVSFIDDWYGVTYKYGGADKHGIDCSHFAAKLYADIYHKSISGAANTIEPLTTTVKTAEMQEGDMVFFKIAGNKVSHVGVYIGNNKFVHATTKRGVMISDLDEPYYKKYFYKAGKLK
ncbi:MAG: NlpC/P60 family protein [Bacteroidia bacterium]